MSHRCDACNKGRCAECATTVTVMDQDGPQDLICPCSCQTRKYERIDADRKLRHVASDYERSYGLDALLATIGHGDLIPALTADDQANNGRGTK